jgi:hypothetical protein
MPETLPVIRTYSSTAPSDTEDDDSGNTLAAHATSPIEVPRKRVHPRPTTPPPPPKKKRVRKTTTAEDGVSTKTKGIKQFAADIQDVISVAADLMKLEIVTKTPYPTEPELRVLSIHCWKNAHRQLKKDTPDILPDDVHTYVRNDISHATPILIFEHADNRFCYDHSWSICQSGKHMCVRELWPVIYSRSGSRRRAKAAGRRYLEAILLSG